MTTPKATLVLAVQNQWEELPYLRRRAETLAAALPELEILWVDVRSEDGTRQEIASWPEPHRLLRLPRRMSLGQSWWEGAKTASGEVVLFCEASLRIEHQDLRELVETFRVSEIVGVSAQGRFQGPGFGLNSILSRLSLAGLSWVTGFGRAGRLAFSPAHGFRSTWIRSLEPEAAEFFPLSSWAQALRSGKQFAALPLRIYPSLDTGRGPRLRSRDLRRALLDYRARVMRHALRPENLGLRS